jgi:fructose-1-phosphate kinase PfkB-like protein
MEATLEVIGNSAAVLLPGTPPEASNARSFKQEINQVLESNMRVIFDLSQLHFVELERMHRIFDIYNSRGEVLPAFEN